jgi:SAM-dependent methyltransferase
MSVIDFNALGAEYDRSLAAMQPAAAGVLGHLPTLPAGATVVDIACGTGEPGLTLAQQRPDLQVIGVDVAEQLIGVADAKARQGGITNIRFQVSAAEALDLPTESVDAVISRFGLLFSISDAQASMREALRILRLGGAFSLAVWGLFQENKLYYAAFQALSAVLSERQVLQLGRLDRLAAPGLRESQLRDAGFSTVSMQVQTWTHHLPDSGTMWNALTGPGLFTAEFAALNEAERIQAQQQVNALLAEYRQPDGSYDIPCRCDLYWGSR